MLIICGCAARCAFSRFSRCSARTGQGHGSVVTARCFVHWLGMLIAGIMDIVHIARCMGQACGNLASFAYWSCARLKPERWEFDSLRKRLIPRSSNGRTVAFGASNLRPNRSLGATHDSPKGEGPDSKPGVGGSLPPSCAHWQVA